VAAVDGVGEAAPLGENTFTVETMSGELKDATIFGYELGGPGAPTTLSSGRLPQGPGEGVVSSGAGAGFAIADRVQVLPGGYEIEVVGVADDASFNVQPTLFVSYPSYEEAVRAQNPDAQAILPTLVAVDPEPGVTRRSSRPVSPIGCRASRPSTWIPPSRRCPACLDPAVVRLILALAFFVVILVTGFFFLILTVQKTQALTLLRAVGASTGYLLKNCSCRSCSSRHRNGARGGPAGRGRGDLERGLPCDRRSGADREDGRSRAAARGDRAIGSIRRVARLDAAAATTRGAGGGLA